MKAQIIPLLAAAAFTATGPAHANAEEWVGSGPSWAMELGSTRLSNGVATTRLVVTTVPQQSTPIPWDYVVIDASFNCQTRRVTYRSKVFHTVTPLGQREVNLPEPETVVHPGSTVETALKRACGETPTPGFLTRYPSARAYYDQELARPPSR